MNKRFLYSPFIRARITLTLWYCFILLIILVAFSTVLYTTQTRDYGRIIIMRDFGDIPPPVLTPSQFNEVQEQITDLRRSFLLNLLVMDLLILIGGGGLGYILAGKTLEPIQKNLEQQKKFIADASHELRTPLAAIKTGTEVALRSKDKTKQDYKKVLEQTYQESSRMGKLVEELLMLSRIESGIVHIKQSSEHLDIIVKNAIEELYPLFAQKKLKVKEKIEKDVIVRGDANRLKQLVLIFLDNAIKYTPEKGTITILLASHPRCTLTIEDTGIGMDREDKAKIFDRFYQADLSRTGDGAGLGLSIAHWILEAHKATIAIDTKHKKGTRITITFPHT